MVEAFTPEIEQALAHPADFKSALQERLARRGTVVTYEVAAEEGPPHERTFEVVAMVDGEALARGCGRSKKDAEQAAAEAALDVPDPVGRMHLSSITLKGFKSFPDRTRLTFAPGVSVIVGPNGSGKSNITDAVLWAMGEQSPVAVRGASMQDVIFAGAHGVQARSEAEVEVVLDNASGGLDLPVGEVSITRRLNRAGEGEYRINGAKCRLTDVIEILSDTGLGKEMHSVVSQGRVAEIVTSKPRDRRMLIEEAAGLGKHRKRRRRAQLKLERTQDNLDRALDVEREARTRLKPLKRQAEAAELHERIERQMDEARWTLARDGARVARAALAAAEEAVAAARAAAAATEAELTAVGERREAAEEALSARGRRSARRCPRASTPPGPRPSGSAMRLDAAQRAAGELAERAARRRELDRAPGGRGRGRHGRRRRRRAHRRAAGRARASSPRTTSVRLERELAELEARREAATRWSPSGRPRPARRPRAGRAGEAASEAARKARRELDNAAEKARRESARIGAELAKVNQFLRANAGAPGGAHGARRPARRRPGLRARPDGRAGPAPARGRRRRPGGGRRAAVQGRQGRRRGADRPGEPRRRRAARRRRADRRPPSPRRRRRRPPPRLAARRPAPSPSPRTSRPPATTPPDASPPPSSPTSGSSSPSTGSIPPSPASP